MGIFVTFIFYTIALFVLVLIYRLARLIVKKVFEGRKLKYNSRIYPFILSITVLSIGFANATNWNYLIDFLIGIVNNSTPLEVSKIHNSEFYTLIVYTVFCLSICYLIFQYASKNQTIREDDSNEEEEEEESEEKDVGLTPPPAIPEESPIFWQRIQQLFELKIKNAKLLYDKQYKTLTATYKEGLHDYVLIVYCDNGVNKKTIQQSDCNRVLSMMKEEVLPRLSLVKPIESYIVDFYFVLENGNFDVAGGGKMVLYTEDDFINNLIDFTDYLQKNVYNYTNDQLPFSALKSAITLKETFISPNYNKGKASLDKYLDDFLVEESHRHIAVLGSYGMGKTSFLKYYTYRLSKEILENNTILRYPVFISLTNTSPMHEGIKTKTESFVSKNLGVDYKLFEKLVHRGKIIFLLDGFDEMGFIGTHQQRFRQLDAIWRLATKNNKIIISGRPSYFPTEDEMIKSLNIRSQEELVPKDLPYCMRIELDEFSDDQIRESIALFYNADETKKYFNFIRSNESVYDLCKRPSMLHIVREMLPVLLDKYEENQINSSLLMEQYIDHWIERQNTKNIRSAIEIKAIKNKFIKEFFYDLAGDNYDSENGNAHIYQYQISRLLTEKLQGKYIEQAYGLDEKIDKEVEYRVLLYNKTNREGLENEIMSGYFIQRNDDIFKFVHKSFFEFFVAKKILSLLEKRDYGNSLISGKNWSKEITNFVFDNENERDNKTIDIPYLLRLTSRSKGEARFKFSIIRQFSLTEYHRYLLGIVLVSGGAIAYLEVIGVYDLFIIIFILIGLPAGIQYRERFASARFDIDELTEAYGSTLADVLEPRFEKLAKTIKSFSLFGRFFKKFLVIGLVLYGLSQIAIAFISTWPQEYLPPESYSSIMVEYFKSILLTYIKQPIHFVVNLLWQGVKSIFFVLVVSLAGWSIGLFLGMQLEKYLRIKFGIKSYYIEASTNPYFKIEYFEIIKYFKRIYRSEVVLTDNIISSNVSVTDGNVHFENVLFDTSKVNLDNCTLSNCRFTSNCRVISLNNCDIHGLTFEGITNPPIVQKRQTKVYIKLKKQLDSLTRKSISDIQNGSAYKRYDFEIIEP